MRHRLGWKGVIGIAAVGFVFGLIFLAGGERDIAGVLFVVAGLEAIGGALILAITTLLRRSLARQ